MTGGDADQLARSHKGILPVVRACEIVRDCAAGLCAIHRAGLIHRDIKPANIFLGEDGTAKLADLSSGADGAAQGKAVAEVQAIIQDYTKFVDTDPMVAVLETNPMHPVKLRAVLDTALAALTKQPSMGLHTDGNVGMVLT